jgi:hypothetical protein
MLNHRNFSRCGSVNIAILWYGITTTTHCGIKLALRLLGHREALLSQCPSMLVPSAIKIGLLPINRTHWDKRDLVGLSSSWRPRENWAAAAAFAKQEILSQEGWQLILPEKARLWQSPSRGPDDMELDPIWISDILDGLPSSVFPSEARALKYFPQDSFGVPFRCYSIQHQCRS